MGEVRGGFTKEAECVVESFLGRARERGAEAGVQGSGTTSEGGEMAISEEVRRALSFTMLRLGVRGY